ncbi:MAG: thymidine phosphorylase [Euryarchaeota archaeon]|nr:thymidine phosphorylase [Euryarchaeota archaeon]|tara:strand:+ start:2286 stop:3563 length:1278 start_codon:yes stop_codon:yes gene_type:complete
MSDSIADIVNGVVDGSLSDELVIDWLRDIFENGLDENSTIFLTKAMRDSGKVLAWPKDWSHLVVDKHSTGGVGDKVSIILAPALAACGLKVPMISGRGLGHTGGTLDKLESIAGFRVDLSINELQKQVGEIGFAMVGQTDSLVPADRRMYALRDVTGTVASIPLITSSIVSKKAAEGISALVLDVKYGRAAFMTEREQAEALSQSMADAANGMGIATSVVLSTMDQPLGCAVGNALEIVESVETLCGRGPHDLEELVCVQAGILLAASGIVENMEEGALMIHNSLNDGSAFTKFLDMVEAQGGNRNDFASDHAMLSSLGLLGDDLLSTEIYTEKKGWIKDIDAMSIALACLELGSGRKTLTDSVDHSVGAIIEAQVGDEVEIGDPLIVIYHRKELPDGLSEKISSAFSVSLEQVSVESRISQIIG